MQNHFALESMLMILKKTLFLLCFGTVLTLSHCDFKRQSPERVKAYAEEVERRKIKRVTNIALLDKLETISQSILTEINDNNIDTLEKEHRCMIQRISLTADTFPDSLASQLAEAYSYSFSLGQKLKPTTQFSPDEDFLIYTKPYEQHIAEDSVKNGFWYIRFEKKEIVLKL